MFTLHLERADRDVIAIQISQRKLLCSRVPIGVWLFFKPHHKRTRPLQRRIEIIHTEEQQESVTGHTTDRAHQGGMVVRAPFVKAQ
jgi:hypothetical protein